jgi:Tol biopolymer transport system component
VSADGRFVAFVCDAANLVPGDTNDVPDVFRRDRQTGRTQRVSLGEGDVEPDGPSAEPAISQNGLLIAFASAATNLLNPQSGDHNESWDVFARLQPAPSP